MILEYWQGSGDLLHGLSVVARAVLAAGALGVAGAALYIAFMDGRLTAEEERSARRWLAVMVLAALAGEAAALALRAAVLSGTSEGAFRTQLLPDILASRFGDALMLRLAGYGLALFALVRATWGASLGAIGAAAVAASFAAAGHAAEGQPRQELAVLATLHVAGAAFWFGSLMPLRALALRRDPASAAETLAFWSRAATVFVALSLVSGLVLATLIGGPWRGLARSWYGWALIVKGALAALLLAAALKAKLRHARLMARGDVLASSALHRSIGRQALLALAIIYAAAELASAGPR